MKNRKYVNIILFIIVLIGSNLLTYLKTNQKNSLSKNMLYMGLLQSLEKNDTKVVKKILTKNIIYQITNINNNILTDTNRLCLSWNDKVVRILKDNDKLFFQNKNKAKAFYLGADKLDKQCKK